MITRRLKFLLIPATVLLLIPLIAMQFTDEVNWTVLDFVVGAALLFGAAFMLDLLLRKIKQTRYRVAAAIALLIILVLIWAELAVGIFGTPFRGS